MKINPDIKCHYCGCRCVKPHAPHLFGGFYDMDMDIYVCYACRNKHYRRKMQTPYAGMYHEIPVPLPQDYKTNKTTQLKLF